MLKEPFIWSDRKIEMFALQEGRVHMNCSRGVIFLMEPNFGRNHSPQILKYCRAVLQRKALNTCRTQPNALTTNLKDTIISSFKMYINVLADSHSQRFYAHPCFIKSLIFQMTNLCSKSAHFSLIVIKNEDHCRLSLQLRTTSAGFAI